MVDPAKKKSSKARGPKKSSDEKKRIIEPYLTKLQLIGLELAFAAERGLGSLGDLDEGSLDLLWRIFEDTQLVKGTPVWKHLGGALVLEGAERKHDNFLPWCHDGFTMIYEIINKFYEPKLKEKLKKWQKAEIQTLLDRRQKKIDDPKTLDAMVLLPKDWDSRVSGRRGPLWAAYKSTGLVYGIKSSETVKRIKERYRKRATEERPLSGDEFGNVFRIMRFLQQSAISSEAVRKFSSANSEAVSKHFQEKMNESMSAVSALIQVGFFAYYDAHGGEGRKQTEMLLGLDRLRSVLERDIAPCSG